MHINASKARLNVKQRERERERERERTVLNFSNFEAFVRFGEVFKLSQAFYVTYLEKLDEDTLG